MSIALRAVASSCLLALLLGAAACDADTPSTGTGIPSGSTGSTAPGSSGFFGGTDLAWVEITIAMNEQLLPLLALAPTHSSDPALQAVAAEVQAGHQQELGVLRTLHDQANLPAQNPHKGMPMPGMVTLEQVREAAATKGTAFDRLLTKHLRAHLEQGAKLAGSEQKAGVEPQTTSLAARVLSSRARFLTELSES